MPVFSLSSDEARELRMALDVRLHALRVELTFTDLKDYRALVRERLDTLEAIAARLDAEGRAERPPAP